MVKAGLNVFSHFTDQSYVLKLCLTFTESQPIYAHKRSVYIFICVCVYIYIYKMGVAYITKYKNNFTNFPRTPLRFGCITVLSLKIILRINLGYEFSNTLMI